jgi:hypothetical protein
MLLEAEFIQAPRQVGRPYCHTPCNRPTPRALQSSCRLPLRGQDILRTNQNSQAVVGADTLRVQAMKKESQQQFGKWTHTGKLMRNCDHIRAKEQGHTHQNGQVAGGKESFGGACADVRNGLLVRKSRQKFVRRVVRPAPHLICQLQCGLDRDTPKRHARESEEGEHR